MGCYRSQYSLGVGLDLILNEQLIIKIPILYYKSYVSSISPTLHKYLILFC